MTNPSKRNDNNEAKSPSMGGGFRGRLLSPSIFSFLQDKGLELYGKNFRLLPEDEDIILKLVSWFIKDEETARKLKIDLGKGILLTGPVGCGKTSLMSVCRFLLKAEERHTIRSCRDVAFEFMKDGHEIFHRYTRGSFRPDRFEPKTYCFDDLGVKAP